MRTRTIFKAWQKTMPAYPPPLQVYERDRKRLRQNIAFGAEFERRMDERDLLLEMHGNPTPIYDKLKAEGLNPPVSVMLIDSRKLTAEEVAYGLSLLEAE